MKSSTLPDVSGLTDTVTDTVSDAVSSGIDIVQDVAGTLVGLAPVVADTVVRNASSLVEGLGSSSGRRIPLWMLIAAAVGGFVLVAWVLKRRRTSTASSPGLSDLRQHSEQARAAAAG